MSFFTNKVTTLLMECVIDIIQCMFNNFGAEAWQAYDTVTVSPDNWLGGKAFVILQEIHQIFLPIGAVILTFFIYYEMYQMVMDNNNMSEFSTFNFIKLVLMMGIGAYILINSLEIVMGFFSIGNKIATDVMGVTSATQPQLDPTFSNLRETLKDRTFFELLGMWMSLSVMQVGLSIVSVIIWAIIEMRMIQIYFYSCMCAIPLSTVTSKEFRNIGINYIKILLAYALQSALILFAYSIYAVMMKQLIAGDEFNNMVSFSVTRTFTYSLMLYMAIKQSFNISKSVVNAV